MRKLIVDEWMALDGVVQGPSDPDEDSSGGFEHGGWHMPYFDECSMEWTHANVASAGGYVLGRRTYEIFAAHWPNAGSSRRSPAATRGLPIRFVEGVPIVTDAPAPQVFLRSEQSGGRVSVIESVMPPGVPGPPLHAHDFDEAFYILEGELTFQLDDQFLIARAGELAFAPGGIPHTLANRSGARARFLIVCTPAGFEREFARRAAANSGVEPPAWAMQPIPEVTVVGPPMGRDTEASAGTTP
jgi:quercetin dioxygenase-like cupin family protein